MNGTPKAETQEAHKQKRPPKKPPIIRVLRTLKRRYHTRKRGVQKDKEANERTMARWTRNVGFFTLGLVVVGLITAAIFKWQLDAMQGQLNVMEADQRPWIEIQSIALASDFVFEPTPDDHEVRVDLLYHIKNVGHAPAVRIYINDELIISVWDELVLQRRFCDGIRGARQDKNSKAIRPEISLFPGNEVSFQITAWMTPDKLKLARDWAATSPGAIAVLSLVGCVSYEFANSEGVHQTGVIREFRKKTPYSSNQSLPSYAIKFRPGTPITNWPGAIHLEGTIPASDLNIVPSYGGTGPID